MKSYLYLTTALLGLCLPVTTFAQEGEAIITISRAPLPMNELAQTLSRLDQTQITNTPSALLVDAIKLTPSANIIAYGGRGQTASLSLRGAGTDHTLILMDGVRLNDPSLVGGGNDSGLINLSDIDHIEILRGPFSTLWGSGALGGVISMTSKTATKPFEGSVAITGLDDYYTAQTTLGGKQTALNWRLTAAQSHDRGISAFDKGVERDGFSQSQVSGQMRYSLSEGTQVFGLTQWRQSRVAIDGYAPPTYEFGDTGDYGKSQTALTSFGLSHKGDWGNAQISIGHTDTQRHNYDDQDSVTFVASGKSNSVDAQTTLNLGARNDLLLGLGLRKDSMSVASPSSWDTNPTPLVAEDKSHHIFALYRQKLIGGVQADIGARFEKNEGTKGVLVTQLGIIVPIAEHVTLKSAIGTGFKAPSLYQRFSDYGNLSLKAEHAQNAEIGLVYQTKTITANATYYHRNVKDLIGFASCYGITSAICTTRPYGYYDNIQKVVAQGLELGLSWQISPTFSANSFASFQSNENRSIGYKGLDLARTPHHIIGFTTAYSPNPKWDMVLSGRHVGQSYDDAANHVQLKAYSVFDMGITYSLTQGTRLTAKVENIGDKQYQSAKGYAQNGRRLWLGINKNF